MQDEDEDRQRERDDDCSLGEVNENTNERKKSTKKENGKPIFFSRLPRKIKMRIYSGLVGAH